MPSVWCWPLLALAAISLLCAVLYVLAVAQGGRKEAPGP